MRRMKHFAGTALILGLALAGCSESSTEPGDSGSVVHEKAVLMGNFQINSVPVVTNQDGTSKNIIDDYVLPSQLPNVDLELFTMHLYAPVDADVSTTVSNVRVYVGRTDGSRTGDIYLSGQFLQRTTVNGQLYSVYQLNGIYRAPPTLRKTNFANVTFEMTLSYEDAQGKPLTDRAITLSVYQRT